LKKKPPYTLVIRRAIPGCPGIDLLLRHVTAGIRIKGSGMNHWIMFEKVFGRSGSGDDATRRFHITMSSKKPITLRYSQKEGEDVLLAQDTTSFQGEIAISGTADSLRCTFEGESLKARKNSIRLDIEY
jgi:hypothetical protein